MFSFTATAHGSDARPKSTPLWISPPWTKRRCSQHLEDLKVFYARCLQLHFTLFISHTAGLYELAVACEELLGWDLQKTIGLLQGADPAPDIRGRASVTLRA